ncbi:hypothetical protein [Botrimarina hoheduenensis]|uniref:Type 4 fimbrial biogenesis protein PilX N-terminal domain-containing protein n=1 Tax=Botrimarina hoheduenensis TaxID=2528000 RepID=A0A5C5WFK6_9BACT|nr:hypothetical protein [Botrimarina hoheduenensis]TWT48869.1 hypothetical protein Pla111_06450 [Botrimarina hoheduenensis]
MVTNTRQPRRGAALLMCLFIVLTVTSLVINVIDTETLQLAATRNTIEYEQSLYWANGGIHRACVDLMLDPSWRGVLIEGTLPPAADPAGYSVTVAEGALGIVIVSSGYSGRGHRTLQATVEL